MITREEITGVVAECMALQAADAVVGYDTAIVIDSFSFVWLQHVLGERFGFDLEPPGADVMPTLDSARSVHRYLAGLSPDRFAAVPRPGTVPDGGDRATALDPGFEAVLRECLDGLLAPETPLRDDSDLGVFGIDSLTVVRLLVTIEETFGVMIPDEVITFEIFSSPGALWNVVSGLREAPDEH